MQKKLYSKGFTLVETLVAVTVLAFAVLAPFGAVQSVLRATQLSREQLTASFLAQEALETVRSVRYNNYLAYDVAHNYNPTGYEATLLNGDSTNDLTKCSSQTKLCMVDASFAVSQHVIPCTSGTACVPVRFSASTGIYTQDTSVGSPTVYTRSVWIANQGSYQTVHAQVSWNDHGPHSVTISEDLYDWL